MAKRSAPAASAASSASEQQSAVAGDGSRIGAQLKGARLAQRMTLAEVALRSGLTKGFLSKLERDQATASVASLMRLVRDACHPGRQPVPRVHR